MSPELVPGEAGRNHRVKVRTTEPGDLMGMLISEVKVGAVHRNGQGIGRTVRHLNRIPGLEPRGKGETWPPYLFLDQEGKHRRQR